VFAQLALGSSQDRRVQPLITGTAPGSRRRLAGPLPSAAPRARGVRARVSDAAFSFILRLHIVL